MRDLVTFTEEILNPFCAVKVLIKGTGNTCRRFEIKKEQE